MAQSVTLAKAERMQGIIDRQRQRLREGARLGSNALLASLGGGVASGFLQKKMPTLWGTSIASDGAAGVVFIMGAMAGMFGDYGDEAASLGSGLLASAVSREAAGYFE